MVISDLFGGNSNKKGNDSDKPPSLPRDVKEAVSSCRSAVQEALQRRTSRMDVEFPVGTKFNVEKEQRNKKSGRRDKDRIATDDEESALLQRRRELDTSDRELARLFVDMFQPVGGERISVVFVDTVQADVAKQRWKNDPTAKCRIMAMDRRRSGAAPSGAGGAKKKKKKVSARGFAAKLAAEIGDSSGGTNDGDGAVLAANTGTGSFQLPDDTEVALFVAPGPKELVKIEKICDAVGMGTLVVLLNARLLLIDNFGSAKAKSLFTEEFEPVFCLSAAPQQQAPGCLLYRAYPGPFVLARKPKVGQPKPIRTYDKGRRPTLEECEEAYSTVELSDVEKGVEGVAENVANWFQKF